MEAPQRHKSLFWDQGTSTMPRGKTCVQRTVLRAPTTAQSDASSLTYGEDVSPPLHETSDGSEIMFL